MSNNRFKVLGVNDDRDFCECCGKSGLTRVAWIQDAETGEIRHFGVVCAAKPAKGFSVTLELKQAERSFKAMRDARMRRAHRIYSSRGGKWASDGIPLHEGGALLIVDRALFNACYKEAA